MANLETSKQNDAMMDLSAAGMLVWRQMVGLFRRLQSDHKVKVGVTGQSDIGGIYPVVVTEKMVGMKIGVAVQVEMKVSKKKGSDIQEAWGDAVKDRGGIYFVANDGVDALKKLRHHVELMQQGVKSQD